jgi:hypothetical protein
MSRANLTLKNRILKGGLYNVCSKMLTLAITWMCFSFEWSTEPVTQGLWLDPITYKLTGRLCDHHHCVEDACYYTVTESNLLNAQEASHACHLRLQKLLLYRLNMPVT